MTWISTKEKLPKNEQYVLVFTREPRVTIGQFVERGDRFRHHWTHWLLPEHMADVKDVTHWQPLPDPPAEAK